MNRPLFSIAIFFSLGIILAYYFSHSLLFMSLVLCTIFFIILLCSYFNKEKIILVFILSLLFGFSLMTWQEMKYQSPYSLIRYNDIGIVEVLGEIRKDLSSLQGNKILLKPYFIDDNRVNYGLIEIDKRYIPLELSNGDVIRIMLSLSQPRKKTNPGGFSHYNYLKKQGIYSVAYYQDDIEIIGKVDNIFENLSIQVKNSLINIVNTTTNEPYNYLIKGFLLGEREDLPEEWVDYFTLAGIHHLLAISGLHVGFILIFFLFILKKIKLNIGIRNLFLSLLLMFYIFITGFRPSVFRAGFLSIAFLWAPYFHRKPDVLNIIGLTALLNLLLNPYELFTISFQLSYFVLISIIIWYEIINKLLPSYIAISTAALIGSTPFTIYYFNNFTPISIISNIWAIPLMGLIVSLALISLFMGLFFPFLSSLINSFLILPMQLLINGAKLMSSLPLAYFEVRTPSIINMIIVLFLIVSLPFLLKKRVFIINEEKRKKALYLLTVLSLLIILVNIFIPFLDNNLKITFIDVGQGDSILIRSPERRYVLIDGGDFISSNSSHGERTLLPLMRSKGIRELDFVFITHFHSDHAAGILDIIGERQINYLVFPDNFTDNNLSQEMIRRADKYDVPIIVAREGDYFRLGDTILHILNPMANTRAVSLNDNSIVIMLRYDHLSVLLTGDLEKYGEERIVNDGHDIASDVLKIGHHGSSTSSTESFLKAVSAEHGIISVGKNNYGHPSSEVLKRAEDFGIKIWRTDEDGAIKLKSDGSRYTIESFLN
ncbi:DNA internalization-related competence protein ComEC/Rec2 [Natronospora cellulosivora (SeqCode)]